MHVVLILIIILVTWQLRLFYQAPPTAMCLAARVRCPALAAGHGLYHKHRSCITHVAAICLACLAGSADNSSCKAYNTEMLDCCVHAAENDCASAD